MSDPVKTITNRIKRRCDALAPIVLRHQSSDRWQSVLFDGGHHRIELIMRGARIGEALAALQDEIDIADFPIPGHLLAEIRVSGIDRGEDEALVTLSAMTIES